MPTFYDPVPLLSRFQEHVQGLDRRLPERHPLPPPSALALRGARRRAL